MIAQSFCLPAKQRLRCTALELVLNYSALCIAELSCKIVLLNIFVLLQLNLAVNVSWWIVFLPSWLHHSISIPLQGAVVYLHVCALMVFHCHVQGP